MLHRIYALTSAGEPTLREELGQFFEEWYASLDASQYENLGFGTGKMISIPIIVFGLCIGLILAAIFAFYDKNRLGGFVRTVIKSECLSPEQAKTLDELGYGRAKGAGIRGSLKHGMLGRVVRCVEKEAYDADMEAARAAYVEKTGDERGFDHPLFVMDFDTAHFYIPDEEHYRAEVRFERKGSGWRSLLLVILAVIAAAGLLFFFLPEILQMLDNMLGIFSDNTDVVN